MVREREATMAPTSEPEDLLPLTPLTFRILLALAGEARHGYALAREIAVAAPVGAPIGTTTVYRAVKRLCASGLVMEEGQAHRFLDDARRRYYGLTPRGLLVARAEERRLAMLLGDARRALYQPVGGA